MPAKILVVDDDAMNRELLSRRLAKRDYETVTAASAYEAMTKLDEQEIDLVILDIMMPGMSGMEMLAVVRQKYSSSQLPVIMATARSDSEDVVEALNRGANDYVIKPLDMAVAFARIDRALKERRTTMALEKMNTDLLLSKSADAVSDSTTSPTFGMADLAVGGQTAARPRESEPSSAGKSIGKYVVKKSLGIGGTGKVYLAYDPLIERNVAIKVLSARHSKSNSQTERFLAEAKAVGQLDHPNIISVHEVNEQDGRLYIVMEYAEGGSLKQRVDQQGPLSLREASRCVIEAAQGLDAAHRGNLVHRDVKPANLLLSASDQIKVGDFGIVKYLAGDPRNLELTQEGRPIGTPQYMSPEQITLRNVDCRTDVYTLGGTFCFLLTGKPPFSCKTVEQVARAHQHDPRPDPARLNPDLPADCCQPIAKAMAIDPNDRFQTMPEFILAVESLYDPITR